jgi:predicted DNA-binding transcriptional regulator AlpA
MLDPSHLISAAEMAKLMGITLRTFRRWQAGGKGPQPIFISGRRFYLRAEAEGWPRQRAPKRQPQSQPREAQQDGE